MRNILALVAALTLSSSTAVSVVACGNTDNTTYKIYDWNSAINGSNGETSSQLFERLLNDPTASGIGNELYKDIVSYISLSILKTQPNFATDYAFAKQAVENQIQNTEDSLKAKYGRSWESHWNDFLKDPAQGGDGNSGSYDRYFDVLLKDKAATIVSQYYVDDNYHNFEYYNPTLITIWLTDICHQVWVNKNQSEADTITNVNNYATTGAYKDNLWIVVAAVQTSGTTTDLAHFIYEAKGFVPNVPTPNRVPVTKDNKQGNDLVTDKTAVIKGLLSDQQADIARVWMKNQGPVWARQIVVPFDDSAKNSALKTAITLDSFKDSEPVLKNIISTITSRNSGGFIQALKNQQGTVKVTDSATTGDLGLVTLNSDSKIKASFTYSLYRYVTSEQGIGDTTSGVAPYNIPNATPANPTTPDLTTFISDLARTAATQTNQTSIYNDVAYINDSDTTPTIASGTSGNKVAVFIDADGIHFVQTPGITYQSTISANSASKCITDFNAILNNGNKPKWDEVATLVNRPNGLTNNPYLAYLQTQYLYWQSNNLTTFFDLNASLKTYTSSGDINSDNWWDYLLYFNHNTDNINWNLNSSDLSKVLHTNIKASSNNVDTFISLMRTWFVTTVNTRWDRQQGTSNFDTLTKNINDLNTVWDGYTPSQNVPPARMDAADLIYYLDRVANQTIWLYDPNSIYN